MKLYTKTGDNGSTGLYGSDRVSKINPRVEAYGTVDELNSLLGLARSHVTETGAVAKDLAYLQNALFDMGADLATRIGSPYEKNVLRFDEADAEFIENLIDDYQAKSPPITRFVHPSGTVLASALHVARAVSRRAERDVIRLAQEEEVNSWVKVYLNRLSDLLFAMARAVNHASGVEEQQWLVGKRR